MLRRGNASNFYVGAAATRGTGDLWNPRAMAGTPPRQMDAVVSFLCRFPNGHKPKAPERLTKMLRIIGFDNGTAADKPLLSKSQERPDGAA